MKQVKIFAQPVGSIGSFMKQYGKFEETLNEWLKQKIDADIIDIRPGYGFVMVIYKT